MNFTFCFNQPEFAFTETLTLQAVTNVEGPFRVEYLLRVINYSLNSKTRIVFSLL